MLFNSWGYVLFLCIAVPLYWNLPLRARPWVLAALSLAFYAMWRWDFAFLLVFSAGVDYVAASRIHASDDRRVRRRWLLLSLSINLGLLAVFKYAYFVSDNLVALSSWLGHEMVGAREIGLRIILPLGISFYTFQTISYTIDVYRGVIEPTRRFAVFLTYVTFWPQLIAGPILRASEVIPQLLRPVRFDPALLTTGVVTILAGLFKKVVLADSISGLVDGAFARNPAELGALDVWVATVLFGFQIYFDFSGYSDIAIGSARLLGIEFPKNFDWPYLATSPRDFWRRWHISLSSWIRDYLYLPLTGQHFQTKSSGGIGVASRSGEPGRTRALFATWFIMGLWHGAAWMFAIWGIYHAAWVYLYRVTAGWQRASESRPWAARMGMFAIAMAGWIPFRAQSLDQTFVMFGKILNPLAYSPTARTYSGRAYMVAALLSVTMFGVYVLRERTDWEALPLAVRAPAIAVAVGVMTAAVIALQRPVSQFIYFQF